MNNTDSTDETLLDIRQHVHEQYGIYFPDKKLYSLESKLERRMNQVDCDNLSEYFDFLKGNPDELPHFLDAITTNKTYFFREDEHWSYFEKKLIPEWDGREDLRIWSAACSSGEEPYSAGLLLEEARQYKPLNIPSSYKILGSDISEQILRVGSRGIYSRKQVEKIRDYQPELVERLLTKDDKENFHIKDSVKNHVYFRQFNLKFDRNPFRYKFDLILLRNVLIYFDETMIENVIHHCGRLLKPGGRLMIGHTENINEIDHSLKKLQPSIYTNG